MKKTTGITVGIFVLMSLTAGWAAPFHGPFNLYDGIAFYVVNPTGQSFDLTVRYMCGTRTNMPCPAMVRVFDPEEKLLFRHELAAERVTPVPWDETSFTVPAGEPGVYQVIVHGGQAGQADIKITPDLEYGVFGSFACLCGVGDQFADTYVYLPPNLPQLRLYASKGPYAPQGVQALTLTDEQGAVKLRLDADHPDAWNAKVDLPPEAGHVWRLAVRGDSYRLDFNVYPIILCPSEACARAIHASVAVMPDGTLCFFLHQIKAWQLLQEYKQRPAEDYQVDIKPLKDYQDAFLPEAARNYLLFGQYGVMAQLPAVLAEQNLDPASPWFGAIYAWKDKDGKARPGNPMADYNRLGEPSVAWLNKDLAAMYWMNKPFNPYYHNPHLLNRIIVAILLDQLCLRPGEYVYPVNTSYYGTLGFQLCFSHSGAFSLVYKDVPPDVQAIWHTGQQRLTDRMLYGNIGGCANQDTVLMAGLWNYYEGTGEEMYKQSVLRSIHWFLTCAIYGGGQRPAGYMTEACGPDATYNGMTGHFLAYIYGRSHDPELLEGLRKCYGLFNHTIASEPGGTWLGSSGFCHRTPGDWTAPQYGAGFAAMAAVLPEAGVRFPQHANPSPTPDEASKKAAADRLVREVLFYYAPNNFEQDPDNATRASSAFDIGFANWLNFPDTYLPGKLPCQEAGSFTRNFGDEFLCVKRPGYYAFLFGAKDCYDWQKANTLAKHYNEQMPSNDGLCMFWSPQFGVSLLTKNWSAAATNTLLADLGDRIEWPDYWGATCKLDADAGTARLESKIQDTPLSYRRDYTFLEDRVECELTVGATAAVDLKSLSECVPFPTTKDKPGGLTVKLYDQTGAEVPSGAQAKAIFFTNDSGQGHLLVLDQQAVVSVGQDHSVDDNGGAHDWGRALIALPATWAAQDMFTLKYSLRPCAAGGVQQALAQ